MNKLIKSFYSDKGGTNNISVVLIVNSRMQVIKTFKSKKSISMAMKRAERFAKKLL